MLDMVSVAELYLKGFHVIPIRGCKADIDGSCPLTACSDHLEKGKTVHAHQVCKRPVFKVFQENPASLAEARSWVWTENGNLAVVAGPSSAPPGYELVIFDYDTRPSKAMGYYRALNTLVCFSPRGYHVYLYARKGMSVTRILGLTGWPEPDTVRGGDMYALVPPSRCKRKSYWWLDNGAEAIRVLA